MSNEFEKIVDQVFKTKSEIWKCFGFPADADNWPEKGHLSAM